MAVWGDCWITRGGSIQRWRRYLVRFGLGSEFWFGRQRNAYYSDYLERDGNAWCGRRGGRGSPR